MSDEYEYAAIDAELQRRLAQMDEEYENREVVQYDDDENFIAIVVAGLSGVINWFDLQVGPIALRQDEREGLIDVRREILDNDPEAQANPLRVPVYTSHAEVEAQIDTTISWVDAMGQLSTVNRTVLACIKDILLDWEGRGFVAERSRLANHTPCH